MTVEVVGGAYDGAKVPTKAMPPWGFVAEYGDDHRIWQAPGRFRELYRLHEGKYVSAEHTHAVCGGCGALSEWSGDGCRLCGSPARAA